MADEVYEMAAMEMDDAITSLKKSLGGLRTGRASTHLLDSIQVAYYGGLSPLNQMATVSTPEPRLIVIQPWDKSAMAAIEKAILASDLGLTPANDGYVIRLSIPQLTEERRKEIVKIAHKEAEQARVEVRRHRRNANDAYKKQEREKELPEDQLHTRTDAIQHLTDAKIQEIDTLLAAKEEEILTV
ncbi:MAG: ribosome recycling factor [Deltaproteobacteria bacterium]|nr:ribosome recycling factor [Deltaproteobacteria bacterium]OIP65105.1 MAG: ribosome recycling factor [Nitrospirae bacterium CG2_30_70_394]PIU78763.1 MAG: ribosome recycling factor [Nitrospirae bacterium CG06_land_8_20_14_3_00_70_43]PIX84427.1 MAG: ribosome recycling factor [Nitrospirae bacterium CG_4_10_14_3_um_filter_70_108]NCP95199.1 ribosome recycling factor [Deltaproteobacteria bacterium]